MGRETHGDWEKAKKAPPKGLTKIISNFIKKNSHPRRQGIRTKEEIQICCLRNITVVVIIIIKQI
jgi:hypothetical protein